MRYGICTGIENAGLVKKLGYDYIELSVTKTMGLDPAAYAAGKKALEESEIEAECFNILFPKTMNFVDGKTTSLDELEIYLEKAMAGLPENFSGKLLEVPVGTGILTMPLYQTLPQADITCLDYSADMMGQAQEKADRQCDLPAGRCGSASVFGRRL